MTFDEWVEKFKPIGGTDPIFFETYGCEKEFISKIDPHHIWTELDGGDWEEIHTGFHFANRMGYFITVIPWEREDFVKVDTDENIE